MVGEKGLLEYAGGGCDEARRGWCRGRSLLRRLECRWWRRSLSSSSSWKVLRGGSGKLSGPTYSKAPSSSAAAKGSGWGAKNEGLLRGPGREGMVSPIGKFVEQTGWSGKTEAQKLGLCRIGWKASTWRVDIPRQEYGERWLVWYVVVVLLISRKEDGASVKKLVQILRTSFGCRGSRQLVNY